MNHNPNGRLAVYANTNGVFYGERLVEELNRIIAEENQKKLEESAQFMAALEDELREHWSGTQEQLRAIVNRLHPRFCTEPLEDSITLQIPKVTQFGTTNISVSIEDLVSGADAFLVQWFPVTPGNPELTAPRNKEEFLYALAALFNARAKRVSMVTPYVYDQRKDVMEGRDSIGAVNFCLELGGITHDKRMQGLCLDIHALQEVGFYQMVNVNMVSVPMFRTFVNFIYDNCPEILENAVIDLPDLGMSKRGRKYAELMKLPRLTMDKSRISPTEVCMEAFCSSRMSLKGKTALVFDDVIGSGGTAEEATKFLKKKRIGKVYWLMTHPELTNIEKLDKLYKKRLFEKIFIADTIKLPERDYFVQVPTAPLVARLMYNIHIDQSIGPYLEVKELSALNLHHNARLQPLTKN